MSIKNDTTIMQKYLLIFTSAKESLYL